MVTNVGASVASFSLVLKVFALGTIAAAGVAFAVSDFTQAQAMSQPTALDRKDSPLWAVSLMPSLRHSSPTEGARV